MSSVPYDCHEIFIMSDVAKRELSVAGSVICVKVDTHTDFRGLQLLLLFSRVRVCVCCAK